MKLNEKFFKQKIIHRGKAVNFFVDEIILPNGKHATREYIDHPGAVAVLAFVAKNKIILVEQYRHPVKQTTFEIPAGKLDKGESIIACVKRELQEETGFVAKHVKKICEFWPTGAFSNEVLHVFTADKLIKAKKAPDDDEFLRSRVMDIKQALKWILNGKIKDSKTIIALLMWKFSIDNVSSR
jgi:ADP-ribose pyrophosphatase